MTAAILQAIWALGMAVVGLAVIVIFAAVLVTVVETVRREW